MGCLDPGAYATNRLFGSVAGFCVRWQLLRVIKCHTYVKWNHMESDEKLGEKHLKVLCLRLL